MSQGGYFLARTGSATKCAACNGKGWLSDQSEPTNTISETELNIVKQVLKKKSAGLNIDEITELTGMDIPMVYRILTSLRDGGIVGIKSGNPIIYYSIEP
jgi:predicted transcriptional regulator